MCKGLDHIKQLRLKRISKQGAWGNGQAQHLIDLSDILFMRPVGKLCDLVEHADQVFDSPRLCSAEAASEVFQRED